MNKNYEKEIAEYFSRDPSKYWDIQDRLSRCNREQKWRLVLAKKITLKDWSISRYLEENTDTKQNDS